MKSQLFSLHSLWRGGRVVEGARLEIVYTAETVSRVRIPLPPPAIKGPQVHLTFQFFLNVDPLQTVN